MSITPITLLSFDAIIKIIPRIKRNNGLTPIKNPDTEPSTFSASLSFDAAEIIAENNKHSVSIKPSFFIKIT